MNPASATTVGTLPADCRVRFTCGVCKRQAVTSPVLLIAKVGAGFPVERLAEKARCVGCGLRQCSVSLEQPQALAAPPDADWERQRRTYMHNPLDDLPDDQRRRLDAVNSRAVAIFGNDTLASVYLGRLNPAIAGARLRPDDWCRESDDAMAEVLSELERIAPMVTPVPPMKLNSRGRPMRRRKGERAGVWDDPHAMVLSVIPKEHPRPS